MMTTVSEAAPRESALLSDEPTIELVIRARGGDRAAVEALIQRCLPGLRRWAHGRLPPSARDMLDTNDLVAGSGHEGAGARRSLRAPACRGDASLPATVGDQSDYRRSASRLAPARAGGSRRARQPAGRRGLAARSDDAAETYERYRAALASLKARERSLVVARVELQWSMDAIARQFGFATTDGARMAITRALQRLERLM